MYLNKISNIHLIILWLSIIFSIGAETSILQNDGYNFMLIIDKVRMIRLKIDFLNQPLILKLFLLYFVFLLFSTLIALNKYNEIHKILLPLYSISLLFLSMIILRKRDSVLTNQIFTSSLFFLLLFSVLTLIGIFFNFFSLDKVTLYGVSSFNFFNVQNSNGVSRIFLVISFFIFYFKKNNFHLILLILMNSIIISLESRFAVSIFIIFNSFACFFYSKNKIDIFKNILILMIVPLLISTSFIILNKNINKEIVYKSRLSKVINNSELFLISSSSRLNTWKAIIKNNSSPIYGLGSQADRILTKKLPKHTRLAANSLVYAYACGGLILMTILLLIYTTLIRTIFSKKYLYNNEYHLPIFIITLILLRSFIENSFSMWGVDFILIIISLLKIKTTLSKIK